MFYQECVCTPAEGEGHEGFPPLPDKDLESPSSTRTLLEIFQKTFLKMIKWPLLCSNPTLKSRRQSC